MRKLVLLSFVIVASLQFCGAQSLDKMQWFNEPEQWEIKDKSLSMQVTPQSDYWRISHYGFTVDDAPFYYATYGGEFEVKVKITGDYKQRFDQAGIAVFKKDGRTTTGRVVAVAGDTVDITKDGLMINGATQISQDIYFDTTQFQNGVDFPITVGEGQIFVLGDNRPEASDSRIYGCINIKDVKGKAIAVIRTRGL